MPSPKVSKHQPVLLAEAISWLDVLPHQWYLDATFGRGGHTKALLEEEASVLALDVDHEAIEYGQETFAAQIATGQLILTRANFEKIPEVVATWKKTHPDQDISGCLFDFGTSADQLTSGERGFSFASDGPLDMRMDTRLGVTAADLLGVLSEKQLTQVFIEYGGEFAARPLAHAIVWSRNQGQPITTTHQLVKIVEQVKKGPRGQLHPATKVFQALRIAVNDELTAVERGLKAALTTLPAQGRIVTISFHEGEDRLAKQLFKIWQQQGSGQVLTKKPVTPGEAELRHNPRARSAKLRAFSKT